MNAYSALFSVFGLLLSNSAFVFLSPVVFGSIAKSQLALNVVMLWGFGYFFCTGEEIQIMIKKKRSWLLVLAVVVITVGSVLSALGADSADNADFDAAVAGKK